MQDLSVTEILEDPWMAMIFGHPVYRIECGPAAEGVGQIAGEVSEHAGRQPGAAFYYAKLRTDRIGLLRELAAIGFYTVDVSITLVRGKEEAIPELGNDGISVSQAAADHFPGVLGIAGSSFEFSRFHLDPAIPRGTADRVKHDWALSYIRKTRGDRLWVALVDGKPAGFLAALLSESGGERLAVVDLMGVGPTFRNRGVGSRLLLAFLTHYRDACNGFQAGTQAANLPSLRLYEKAGFKIEKTAYVMHKHITRKQ